MSCQRMLMVNAVELWWCVNTDKQKTIVLEFYIDKLLNKDAI